MDATRRGTAAAALAVLVCVAWSRGARADVLSPPPDDCVVGSEGVDCHGPPRCAPLSCAGNGDCDDGWSCQLIDLCIEYDNCNGGWGEPNSVPNVTSSCAGGAACASGTCTPSSVCAPGGGPDDAGADAAVDGGDETEVERWGCACRAGAAPSTALPSVLLVALLGAAVSRARRPPGDRSPRSRKRRLPARS
jgi:hypothetical protein